MAKLFTECRVTSLSLQVYLWFTVIPLLYLVAFVTKESFLWHLSRPPTRPQQFLMERLYSFLSLQQVLVVIRRVRLGMTCPAEGIYRLAGRSTSSPDSTRMHRATQVHFVPSDRRLASSRWSSRCGLSERQNPSFMAQAEQPRFVPSPMVLVSATPLLVQSRALRVSILGRFSRRWPALRFAPLSTSIILGWKARHAQVTFTCTLRRGAGSQRSLVPFARLKTFDPTLSRVPQGPFRTPLSLLNFTFTPRWHRAQPIDVLRNTPGATMRPYCVVAMTPFYPYFSPSLWSQLPPPVLPTEKHTLLLFEQQSRHRWLWLSNPRPIPMPRLQKQQFVLQLALLFLTRATH